MNYSTVKDVKYAQKPFISLTDEEAVGYVQGLVKRIKVMTGWPIPELEEDRRLLYAEMVLFFKENWPLYNPEEVAFAIRSYGVNIKNWGKDISLSLISEAMTEYSLLREDVSKIEETKQPKKTNLLTMPADWKELCEKYYQDYRNGKFNFLLMPSELYDEFVKVEMMAADAYEDYLPDAKSMVLGQLKEEKENSFGYERHELEQKIIKVESGEDESNVIRYAKKLSVTLLYKKARAKKFKNLFVNQNI